VPAGGGAAGLVVAAVDTRLAVRDAVGESEEVGVGGARDRHDEPVGDRLVDGAGDVDDGVTHPAADREVAGGQVGAAGEAADDVDGGGVAHDVLLQALACWMCRTVTRPTPMRRMMRLR
jgi:hypothetical protein